MNHSLPFMADIIPTRIPDCDIDTNIRIILNHGWSDKAIDLILWYYPNPPSIYRALCMLKSHLRRKDKENMRVDGVISRLPTILQQIEHIRRRQRIRRLIQLLRLNRQHLDMFRRMRQLYQRLWEIRQGRVRT